MAKLDNVKTVDMVDGVITKVIYKGETYERLGVRRIRGAKLGDIVRNNNLSSDATVGGYYKVIREAFGGLTVRDDVGDDHPNILYYGEIFRKVAPKLMGEHVLLDVKEGDRIRVTNAFASWEAYKNGDILTVTSNEFNEGRPFVHVEETTRALYHYEFEVISDSEAAEAIETAKWAKIGRNPNEYKVGDIARVIDSPAALPNGAIFEVRRVLGGGTVEDNSKRKYVYMVPETQLELITPVEQRFDKTEEGTNK